MIPVSTSKGEYTPVPEGNHVARVYSIIHIGTTTKETQYGPRDINAVRITWELPNERKEFKEGEGEKPFSISDEYNLTFGEKSKLRAIVDGMGVSILTDEGYMDIEKLLGAVCMLNVQHETSTKGVTYANVVSAAPLPKGFTAPEAENPTFVLNYTDKWSQEAYDKLPEFIKKKMADTAEYRAKFDIDAADAVPF